MGHGCGKSISGFSKEVEMVPQQLGDDLKGLNR